MIKIFLPMDKDFTSNGEIIIKPLKAKVHKEDNGDYYLELETSLDYVDYIVKGNIVVANTPQGEQAFRVDNPQKTRKKITVKAYHVFYDSKNYLIEDNYVDTKNCNYALDYLNSNTVPASPFTTLSDVNTINSYRCVRDSLYTAINTIIERWGGHLVRDNFKIEIRNSIGKDNGVTVQYRKNLKEITCDENWDNVVTQLLPVGKDGILLNALDETASLYVMSDTQYSIPYTKTVSFEQDFEQDNFEKEQDYKQALVNDLKEQAQKYVNENCIPQINYTLKANIDTITDVGDTIEVIDERLNIDLLTNVISFTYDCILDKYTEIEFGNFKKNLGNLISNITASIDTSVKDNISNITGMLSSELNQATSQIWGTLGNSYVIYNGNNVMIVDTLPKEDAKNVILMNKNGIGFSSTGINGTFNSAWTIDGTLNMQYINVINLVADMIKGGTLKLGSHSNQNGILELYDDTNTLICKGDKTGLTMYAYDGSYVQINANDGFVGYDRIGNKVYWVNGDEFHMKKSVIEEEITLCNKARFIPITIKDSNGNIVNDGIGLVSVGGD